MDLIQEGRMKPVIDEVLPLERAVEGLRLIENREVFGKVVVKTDQGKTGTPLCSEGRR